MIRVLHILGGLGSGGAEALIMNWYRAIDKTKVQFDFLVRSEDSNYSGEIEKLGGRIFHTAPFPRHFLRNYIETDAVMRRKEWDVIHVHGNAAIYMLPLRLAKKYGYEKVIMHSHSMSAQRKMYGLVHNFNKNKISNYAQIRLACSDIAGRWMFGQADDFSVITNAIEICNFQFSQLKREHIRNEYNLQESYVVGNVGRFSAPKNHKRILSIFKEIHQMKPMSVMLLVGDGELEEQIKQLAIDLGISEAVVFAGRQKDVGAFLAAMDVFLFPSLWEGLGNVLVEALTSGLPCLASAEATVNEIKELPGLSVLSLQENDEKWANQILSLQCCDRESAYGMIAKAGFDSKESVTKLERLYSTKNEG